MISYFVSPGVRKLDRHEIAGHDVIRTVCKHYRLSVAEVLSRCRNRPLVVARMMIIKFLRERGLTLKEIGAILGGRDHTTIIHMINLFVALYKTDSSARNEYILLSQKL